MLCAQTVFKLAELYFKVRVFQNANHVGLTFQRNVHKMMLKTANISKTASSDEVGLPYKTLILKPDFKPHKKT